MRRALGVLALALLVACGADEGPEARLVVDLERAVVEHAGPHSEIVVREGDLVIARRRGGAEASELSVLHGAPPGTTLAVDVVRSGGVVTLAGTVPADPGPLVVELDLPAGQGAAPLRDTHGFTAVEGATVEAAVVITTRAPGPVSVWLADDRYDVVTTVPGERRVVVAEVPVDGASELRVVARDATRSARLEPTLVTRAEAREDLVLGDVVFPADISGFAEPARPPGRVTLPAAWWRAVLRTTELGYRARDPYGPWAFQGMDVQNRGASPLNVVLTTRVLDADGRPAEAFAPKSREQDSATGEVAALLRVPAGSTARARVPFFVDAAAVPEGASTWTSEVTLTPLGSSEPLWVERGPLQVSRGSSWISSAFALALLGALLGILLVATRMRGWMDGFRTRDLVTVAVFATLGFLVSGASAVVSSAVGAVLGPFAIFVTNLLDDVVRYALLATLITLLPRPGVVALSVLLTWVMRGVALGAFSPLDVVFVGGKIFWLEAALWIVGVTRAAAWVDGPAWARFLRLGAGFSVASALTSMTGIVAAMVLFRLFYADWYVAAVIAGPGFLYVWPACALATGFAASLRRVED